ncbi:MAG: adenylosuccinate lyase [Spirochaetaceae bacterium]|nr:MAG: adenylosuccinate lyase [Spirochaetaceae bacterium]
METRSIFRNLSPLDHRYYQANRDTFEALADDLSEEALVRYCTLVEAALLHTHARAQGIDDPAVADAIDRLPDVVQPDEVAAEEEKTHHNVRALVRVIKRYLPESIAPYVHVGATSVDVLDTANALRCRAAVRKTVLPMLITLERELVTLADRHADTLQIGRTHGQHGVPITFGFAIAEYVSRLGKSVELIEARSRELRGKIAGAVGAYNSLSLVTDDPLGFERETLARVGLEASEHSTQLVEPEYLLRLLLELNVAFGVLANLADDLRNLQRTEIAELTELFTDDQVGSSTMPQKRNPWNSEHVKSLWKTFAPRVMTFFMDQISEHQRDLTNSASGRFVVDYLAGLVAAVARMTKVVQTLKVHTDRMAANAAMTGDLILSEAAYTLLATTGRHDAHEDLRAATLESQRTGQTMVSVLMRNDPLWTQLSQALGAVGHDPKEFFSNPASYTGRAAERARALARDYQSRMNRIEEVLHGDR